MKRSEINRLIDNAKEFIASKQFLLPAWASWTIDQWKYHKDACTEIFANKLGWDLTDFGGADFSRRGLILFTVRNGNPRRDTKTYAEKIMVVGENQETPMHFHWHKMEDIINRGGGNLVLQLYGSTPSEQLSTDPVAVAIDGVAQNVAAGGTIVLKPGQSICLTPGLYHRFFGEKERVLVGEVSMVNDDVNDNRFFEPAGRFPEIEEDAKPKYLLVNDYERYV